MYCMGCLCVERVRNISQYNSPIDHPLTNNPRKQTFRKALVPADAEQAAGEILGWEDLGTYDVGWEGSFVGDGCAYVFLCLGVTGYVCVYFLFWGVPHRLDIAPHTSTPSIPSLVWRQWTVGDVLQILNGDAIPSSLMVENPPELAWYDGHISMYM